MKRFISLITAGAIALGSTTVFAETNELTEAATSEPEMIIATMPESYASAAGETDAKYPDLVFTLNDGGTSYTASPIELMRGTEITIPATFKGKPVSNVGGFNNTKGTLDKIIIEGNTDINDDAFNGCRFLKSVTFKSGSKPKKIGNNAFKGCVKLSDFTLPSSVTSLGSDVFSGCEALNKAITVGGTIKLEEGAFRGSCFEKITVTNGMTKVPWECFRNCASLKTLVLPETVTAFDEGAFRDCTALTGFKFPSKVTSIPKECFMKCTSLDKADLTKITEIGQSAFEGCSSLKELVVPGTLKTVTKYSFYNSGIESLVVEKGVENIGDSAFEKCGNLKTANIAAEKISYCGLKNCKALVSLNLTDDVLEFSWNSFEGCSALPYVKIPQFVPNIPQYCFNGCDSLKYMVIGRNLRSIDTNAFGYCRKLTDIYYAGDEKDWEGVYYSPGAQVAGPSFTVHYNSTGPVGVKVNVVVNTANTKVDTALESVTATGSGVTNKSLTITDGLLDISGLANGTYTFTFKAKNCAPRAYKVTVTDGAASGLESGVKLHLYGDINGDGKINTTDILKAKLQTKGSNKLDGYDLAVADANKDGKVNGTDVLKLKLHAKGSTKLW